MILALNTASPQFSLALLREDGSLQAEHCAAKSRGRFTALMPALDFLIASAGCEAVDLRALAVAIGPGSFTGLKVGLATAKGLCHALDIPIIGVMALEALAYQLPYSRFPIAPILHSRKGEIFTARFSWHDNTLERRAEDTCIPFESLPDLFEEPALFIGNDYEGQVPPIKENLGDRALIAPAHCWYPMASTVGYLGVKRFRNHDTDDPYRLNPFYFRGPDIRPNPSPVFGGPSP